VICYVLRKESQKLVSNASAALEVLGARSIIIGGMSIIISPI